MKPEGMIMKRIVLLILCAILVCTAMPIIRAESSEDRSTGPEDAPDTAQVFAFYHADAVRRIKKILTDEKSLVLEPGIPWHVAYTVQPENATMKALKWSTSDKRIATVDKEGNITGIKPGKCTVTGKAKDGSKAKIKIKVKVKKHDVVIRTPGEVRVKFVTRPRFIETTIGFAPVLSRRVTETEVTYQNGCVEGGSAQFMLRPVKAGSDVVVTVDKENGRTTNTEKHTVFVAQSAVK